jgi:hypothetical protein
MPLFDLFLSTTPEEAGKKASTLMPYLCFGKLKMNAIAAAQKAAPIQRLASEKITNLTSFSFV